MSNKIKHLTAAVTLGLGTMLTPFSASAFFDVQEEPAKPAVSAEAQQADQQARAQAKRDYDGRIAMANAQGTLAQFGAGVPTKVSGNAKDIAMTDALLMVVPKGWRADIDPDLRSKKVSWQAENESWLNVIDDIAKQSGGAFVADWDKHLLIGRTRMSDLPTPVAVSAAGESIQLAANGITPSLGGDAGSTVKRATAAPKAAPRFIFKAVKGETAMECVTRWAEHAGWTVDWSIDGDYLLRANAVFSDEIKQSVDGLIGSLNQSSGTALRAAFYAGNKVVRVYRED